MNKSKNDSYHTVLDYQKLDDELALRYYSTLEHKEYKALSTKEKEEYVKKSPLSFINYFKHFPAFETISDSYYDIITSDGRPDYRTIEILYLLYANRSFDNRDGFVVYNGFKVKFCGDGSDNFIYLGALLDLGSNINLHLLSYIVTLAFQEEFPSVKSSYIKLQEFFNETEENIKQALISLQNLNLITFSQDDAYNIVINLNKKNILKLEEKCSNYSHLEEDIAINNHYKERIIKTLSCPHCFEELSKEDIELITANYDEY